MHVADVLRSFSRSAGSSSCSFAHWQLVRQQLEQQAWGCAVSFFCVLQVAVLPQHKAFTITACQAVDSLQLRQWALLLAVTGCQY
jgi:hypothetical protein